MRVKFKDSIELCKKIERCCYTGSTFLKITTLNDDIVYVKCIDEQEAKDLYDIAYVDGYINVSNRFCEWH